VRPEYRDQASGLIRWYSPGEGGRPNGPPSGPSYASTAVFADASMDREVQQIVNVEPYSVVVTFGKSDGKGRTEAKFRFLALDVMGSRLQPGATFYLMEGSHVVGEALVIELLKL